MTFTDYLKEQFVQTGEVHKDNWEDLYPEWLNQLEDEDLDKMAEEWETIKNNKKMEEIRGMRKSNVWRVDGAVGFTTQDNDEKIKNGGYNDALNDVIRVVNPYNSK